MLHFIQSRVTICTFFKVYNPNSLYPGSKYGVI